MRSVGQAIADGIWRTGGTALAALLAALLTAAWAPTARAQEQPADSSQEEQADAERVRVALAGGDVLIGLLVERTDEALVLEHSLLGRITFPADAVVSVEPAPGPEADRTAAGPSAEQSAADAAAGEAAPDQPQPAPPAEAVPEAKSPWTGAIELGANGSQGNTDRANLRFSAEATRERDRDLLYLAALYRTSIEENETIENRLELRSRQEWKSPGDVKRWRFFLTETGEFDEFQDYDFRLAMAAGFRYRFIDTEKTRLIGRIGGGFSREFGSEDDEIKPEGLAAIEVQHRINSRLAFRGLGEIFPELTDFGEFRSLVRGSLDVHLTNDKSLTLRLGAEHRHDSTPGDAKPNDVDYFISLVYTF